MLGRVVKVEKQVESLPSSVPVLLSCSVALSILLPVSNDEQLKYFFLIAVSFTR